MKESQKLVKESHKLVKGAHKLKYFCLGVLVAALVTQFALPALAATLKRTIDVYTGVNIYVDDVKLDPRDANGNPVDAFIYNGTTYLPVRAIATSFGKAVSWDGKTSSVYLGKHSSDEPTIMLKDLQYYYAEHDSYFADSSHTYYKSAKETDNLGNKHSNILYGNGDATYILNGEYTKMVGTFYQTYDARATGKFTSSFDVYGDGRLLYSCEMEPGIKPVPFNIDLTGVLEMRVVLETAQYNSLSPDAALGECGLYS